MSEDNARYHVKCPSCRTEWGALEEFLSDPLAAFLGYQPHFREMTCGFFLFNHLSCRTTLGIELHDFVHLTTVRLFNECHRGTEACPQFCLHNDGVLCAMAQCECEFVLELTSLIQNWPKR